MTVLPPDLDPRNPTPARPTPSPGRVGLLAGAGIALVVVIALALGVVLGTAGLVFGAFLGLTTVLALGVVAFTFGTTGYQSLLARIESRF